MKTYKKIIPEDEELLFLTKKKKVIYKHGTDRDRKNIKK